MLFKILKTGRLKVGMCRYAQLSNLNATYQHNMSHKYCQKYLQNTKRRNLKIEKKIKYTNARFQ